MNDRERKEMGAQRLFDAIGMIDDNIIFEAQETEPKRVVRALPYFRRFMSVAAALIVLTAGIFVGTLISTLQSDDDDGYKDTLTEDNDAIKDGLMNILTSASQNGVASKVSVEDIDFFDGERYIIWKNSGDDGFYSMKLNLADDDENVLDDMISKEAEPIPFESAQNVRYRVWVSYGNGEVVSPHLENSNGNVGYAELFEYSPEVIPTKDFEKLVSDSLYK